MTRSVPEGTSSNEIGSLSNEVQMKVEGYGSKHKAFCHIPSRPKKEVNIYVPSTDSVKHKIRLRKDGVPHNSLHLRLVRHKEKFKNSIVPEVNTIDTHISTRLNPTNESKTPGSENWYINSTEPAHRKRKREHFPS